MSWLSRVRSGIPFLPKRQSTENLWHKCGKCGTMVFVKEWEDNFNVCPRCDYHDRIGGPRGSSRCSTTTSSRSCPPPKCAKTRCDSATASATPTASRPRARDRERDALVNARARSKASRAVVGVQDFAFMGGSMGVAVGAAFVAGVRPRSRRDAPTSCSLLPAARACRKAFCRLMQMPKTTVALAELQEAGLPYIVVLTDPTTGGVTASYAMLGDVQLAEPGALIGFAGQRVIEQTIREKLPEGFQRAEYLLDHGMIDMVVPRGELKERLAQLIGYLAPERKGRTRPDGRFRALRSRRPGAARPAGDAVAGPRPARPRPDRPCWTGSAGRRIACRRCSMSPGPTAKARPARSFAPRSKRRHKAHVFTSPHLVRYNERIRLAGSLIDDDRLAETMGRGTRRQRDSPREPVRDQHGGRLHRLLGKFEADACVVEVELGGRLDATNVIEHPLVCGIASTRDRP